VRPEVFRRWFFLGLLPGLDLALRPLRWDARRWPRDQRRLPCLRSTARVPPPLRGSCRRCSD